jgi:hypothetical protein
MKHDEALAIAQQRRKELAESAQALAVRVRSMGAPLVHAQEALSTHPLWTLVGSFAVGFALGHRGVPRLTATAGSKSVVPPRSRGWMFAASAGLAQILARQAGRSLLDALLLPTNAEIGKDNASVPPRRVAVLDEH